MLLGCSKFAIQRKRMDGIRHLIITEVVCEDVVRRYLNNLKESVCLHFYEIFQHLKSASVIFFPPPTNVRPLFK